MRQGETEVIDPSFADDENTFLAVRFPKPVLSMHITSTYRQPFSTQRRYVPIKDVPLSSCYECNGKKGRHA
jgi:hypothetical protein